MPVPKRRHSKSRTHQKKNKHYVGKVVGVVKTKDKKGYKRPHFDEHVEI